MSEKEEPKTETVPIDLKSIVVKDRVVIARIDKDTKPVKVRAIYRQLSQDLRSLGALRVLVLPHDVGLETLTTEALKHLGLKRIRPNQLKRMSVIKGGKDASERIEEETETGEEKTGEENQPPPSVAGKTPSA